MPKKRLTDINTTKKINRINVLGKTLSNVGIELFPLKANKIIQRAKKKAGFSGSLSHQVIEGLEKMVFSLNTEAKLNAFGKIELKKHLERNLYSRLKVDQHLAKNPEIKDLEIKEPIFIIGMPKTGRSILHALLDQDHAHRSPLSWECLLPSPLPNIKNDPNNSQEKIITKEFNQLFNLVPLLKADHYREANAPQDCVNINALDFNSFQIAEQAYVPSYIDWFSKESNKLETMRFHKRFLQYLQSGGVKSNRWLLKSPLHILCIPEIFKVYPDAKIILMHRKPSEVLPSLAGTISTVRSLYSDSESFERTAHEQADLWGGYFNTFVNNRKNLQYEHQIIDLKFDNFIKHPLTVLSIIYEQFEWPLSENVKLKFQNLLDNYPKEKNKLQSFKLQDLGLTKNEIAHKFKSYIGFIEKM